MKTQIRTFIILTSVLLWPQARASDSALASFNISGTVPTFFSVSTRGVPGDMDLSPKVTVNNRRVGLLHFKYNANVASITVASNTPSGGPEGPSGAYNFNGGFKVSIEAGCTSVDVAYNSPFVLLAAGTDVKSANSAALTTGVEEDCSIMASWKGTNQALPLAGVYSLNIAVTMVSQ